MSTGRYQYDILPKTTRSRFFLILGLVGGTALLIGYFATFLYLEWESWDDTFEVTYVNPGSERLFVFYDDFGHVALDPGETQTYEYVRADWFEKHSIVVKNVSGDVRWQDMLDEDDLEDRDRRIVIEY